MARILDRPRQLLIGLDAMEWSLVAQWAAEGKLPTLRRLMESGVRASLSSSAESLADTAWAALCCGVNPGKLRKYFYVQYQPDTGSLRYMYDSDIAAPPFWHYLDQAGVRTGIVDAPHVPFREMVHGFQVSQWGSHDNVHQPRTSPLALLQEIGSALGLSPLADCEKYNDSPRGLRKLRQAILDGARAHGELFRWLMRHRRWDVFCAVFAAPHCVGHRFWRFMDPSWPDYRDGELADTIESAYRAVDSEIDRMLAVAGDQTRVLAVAAHGMGPLYHASWNLDQILDLLGFNGERRSRGKSVGNVNPWRILKMTIPSRLQYLIKESLPRALQDYLVFRWYAAGRKYAGRRVFAVPNNDNAGAIRISVAGRDRKGLVDPAEEYRRLRDEIAKALRELTDPITGRPVVEEVISLHEKYAGPHVSGLPDLAVRWNHSFPWRAVHSPRFGTLPVPCQDLRSGSHGPRGFLIAAGPGIPAGAELEGCSIYDIAPTILQAAGVPVPETMDGRPLTALCRQLSAAIAR